VGQGAGRVKGVGGGAAPGAPAAVSRWRKRAARAGLVCRLRAKQKPVTPDPALTWGKGVSCVNLMQIALR
jgi:hypothetical protein